jgi:hypothetical protein
MAVTPISRPIAHEVSVRAITRPRVSKGTRSLIQAPRPRSNSTLLCASTINDNANHHTLVLAAADSAPAPTMARPRVSAVRRCMWSPSRAVRGDMRPDSSVTANAVPMRSSVTPWPVAMVARNGGANRKHAFAQARATVSNVTRCRTSAE